MAQTDAGNVVWFDRKGGGEKVRTRMRINSPVSEGVLDVLGGALQSLGIAAITQEAPLFVPSL